MKKKKSKIVVIGWDAADWKVINPLLEQGKLPGLQSVMNRGVHGKIQTLDPPLSPMLWTSIATGVRADKHGITGFVEPTPSGDGIRPVTSTSRKVKAIWNILNQNGWKSNVVAWWPSNPAEPINGVMVSNLYQLASKEKMEEWEMPAGTIHPESMNEIMAEFRVHPHEITLAMMYPFVPDVMENVELRREKKTVMISKTISQAASVHAASTYLMQETEWDFMAVYHDAIDHFCHIAMRYYPPRRPEISEKDYEFYKGVVEAGYRYQDMMLERTLEMIDDDTTILILSDHGFHSDHQRPLYIPNEPSGLAVEHSPYGIFVMAGPGIRKNQTISGASVLDVTPTLLYHAGLPVGKDMEGKVLYQCFENPIQAQFVDSWENIDGDTGQHDASLREDPWAAQEALQQLVDLGYIDAIDGDAAHLVETQRRENDYYVARNMINGGRINGAIEILERIFNESGILRYGQRLAFAYLSRRMYMKCSSVLEKLKDLDKIERKKEKENPSKPNLIDPLNNSDVEEPLYIEYIEGLLALAMNQPRKALPLLEKVQSRNESNIQLALSIAQIHLNRRNYKLAEKQFIRALSIDDRNANAHYGLGLTFLRSKKYEAAIDEFLIATEQDFYQPQFHYFLGEALAKLGLWNDAVNAFEVATKLRPGMSKAHKWLVQIYSSEVENPEKKAFSESVLKDRIKGEITICTGFSEGCHEEFLMELQNAGVDTFTDIEKTKEAARMMFHGNFLQENKDKVIYVPIRFLSDLPAEFNYKVIYLYQSDKKMLEKLASKDIRSEKRKVVPMDALQSIRKEIALAEEWLESNPQIGVLNVNWDEFQKGSKDQIYGLELFLDQPLKR